MSVGTIDNGWFSPENSAELLLFPQLRLDFRDAGLRTISRPQQKSGKLDNKRLRSTQYDTRTVSVN